MPGRCAPPDESGCVYGTGKYRFGRDDQHQRPGGNGDGDCGEEFEYKTYDIENQYKSKIRKLEKENNYLNKIINKFWETLDKFIHWICRKFDIAEEDNLIRDFQEETNTFIDPEKQMKNEKRGKELDLER